jgi:hypothetical protein
MPPNNYDCSDGIDDDEVDDVVVAASAAYYFSRCNRRTNPEWCRLNRSAHVKKLQRESQFHRMYRMSYRSFKKLLYILKPYLQVNAKQGSCHNWGVRYVSPDLVLHCLLRYLASGSHHDIQLIALVTKSTFFCMCPSGYKCNTKVPTP